MTISFHYTEDHLSTLFPVQFFLLHIDYQFQLFLKNISLIYEQKPNLIKSLALPADKID